MLSSQKTLSFFHPILVAKINPRDEELTFHKNLNIFTNFHSLFLVYTPFSNFKLSCPFWFKYSRIIFTPNSLLITSQSDLIPGYYSTRTSKRAKHSVQDLSPLPSSQFECLSSTELWCRSPRGLKRRRRQSYGT